jgi:hypothetical protein
MIFDEDLDLDWLQLFICNYANPSHDDDSNVPLSSCHEPEDAFDLSTMTALLPFDDTIASEHKIMEFLEFESPSFPLNSSLDSSGSSDVEDASAGEMTIDLDAMDSLISNNNTALSPTLHYDGPKLSQHLQLGRLTATTNWVSGASSQLTTSDSPEDPYLLSEAIPPPSSKFGVTTTKVIDSSKTGLQHVFQIELATKPLKR